MKRKIIYGVGVVILTTLLIFLSITIIKKDQTYLDGVIVLTKDYEKEILKKYSEKVLISKLVFTYNGNSYDCDKSFLKINEETYSNFVENSYNKILVDVDEVKLNDYIKSLNIDKLFDNLKIINKIVYEFSVNNSLININLNEYTIEEDLSNYRKIDSIFVNKGNLLFFEKLPKKLFIKKNERFSILREFKYLEYTKDLSDIGQIINYLSLFLDSDSYIYFPGKYEILNDYVYTKTLVSKTNKQDFSFFSNEDAVIEINVLERDIEFVLYVKDRPSDLEIRPVYKENDVDFKTNQDETKSFSVSKNYLEKGIFTRNVHVYSRYYR